jgi:6-phosphogluconolactonase (cycloisomerase 2 family)
MPKERQSGHLYIQTSGIHNAVIHFLRASDGTITEAGQALTGGTGSGAFNYRSTPPGLIVEGANSVLMTPDRRFLFAVNAGDNSVSSFAVADDGALTLVDVKRTGNAVTGPSGTAKSLEYSPATRTLYVLHTFGPSQIRLFSVDQSGSLTLRTEQYSAVPPDKPGRVTTMLTVSPDEKFLLVGCSMDQLPATNPDGSPILWVSRNGQPHAIAANAPDPDGLAVFPIDDAGALGEPRFHDAGATSPWCPLFLHSRPGMFVIGYATSDGVALATLDSSGEVATGPVVRADTSIGRPSELCWMAITPDDSLVFATMTGYGYVTSWRLDGNILSIARDPACEKPAGDGTFRGVAGIVGTSPNDMWMSPDGAYLYQMYPNASKIIGYEIQSDGWLEEVTSAPIPYNTPQGVTGI